MRKLKLTECALDRLALKLELIKMYTAENDYLVGKSDKESSSRYDENFKRIDDLKSEVVEILLSKYESPNF